MSNFVTPLNLYLRALSFFTYVITFLLSHSKSRLYNEYLWFICKFQRYYSLISYNDVGNYLKLYYKFKQRRLHLKSVIECKLKYLTIIISFYVEILFSFKILQFR